MSFLTPSRIALLALIELYTEDLVPVRTTVPVLSFILGQLLPYRLPQIKTAVGPPLIPSLKSFESLLATANPATTGLPSRTVWDHFLKKLWDIDSIDALHVFFARRANLLTKTPEESRRDSEIGIPPPSPNMILLSHNSPLGIFVCQAESEFQWLTFMEVRSLWIAFVRWRQDSRAYWARRNGRLHRWAADKTLRDGDEGWGWKPADRLAWLAYRGRNPRRGEEGYATIDDVAKLLSFQVEQMQNQGSRVPRKVKDQLKSVLDKTRRTPRLSHYLNFLDAWRAGDYASSFNNLYRYFDYTMGNGDRLCYQYALMNLAVLQADFGCFEEAATTMLETVSTARENKDGSCLNLALDWLYHFGKAHPKIIREGPTNMLIRNKHGLAFLRRQTRTEKMYGLWSSTWLADVQITMSNGDSIANAFNRMLKSSTLLVYKNPRSMIGPHMAMSAALWDRLGVTHLSRQHCEIFLASESRHFLFDDTLRFTCRMAHFLSEGGEWVEAMQSMRRLGREAVRPWKFQRYWQKYCSILRVKRDLHRNNLDRAGRILSSLLNCDVPDPDPDLGFEVNMLHIDYLTRRGELGAALSRVEELAAAVKEDGGDINMRVRLLTAKASLQDKAGRPQKGFSVAVRAASIAWQARLLPSLWAAMGVIANILTSLSEFYASCDILIAILPRALECGSCSLNGQLYALLGNAYMGMAGQTQPRAPQRRTYLSRSFEFFHRAVIEYKAVEDFNGQCEMMAKQATIMKLWGCPERTNDYASAYLAFREREEFRLAWMPNS